MYESVLELAIPLTLPCFLSLPSFLLSLSLPLPSFLASFLSLSFSIRLQRFYFLYLFVYICVFSLVPSYFAEGFGGLLGGGKPGCKPGHPPRAVAGGGKCVVWGWARFRLVTVGAARALFFQWLQTVLIGSERESPWHCSPVLYLPGDNPFRCLELALMSPSPLTGFLQGFSLVSSATACDEFLCPEHLARLSPPKPSPSYHRLFWIRTQSGTQL